MTEVSEPTVNTSTQPASKQKQWVDYSSEMKISQYPWLRFVYYVLGVLAICMGILGYLLPGLPGTVFILIAAYFFGQSSPRFYNWIMNHKAFGRMVRDFRAGKGIPGWVKIYASAMIILFSGSSMYLVGVVMGRAWIAVCIFAVAAYGVYYILKQPTRLPEPKEDSAA